jgi:hypothetical protein
MSKTEVFWMQPVKNRLMKLKLPQWAWLALTELNSVSGVASMLPVSSATLEHPCLLLPSWDQSIGRSRHCRCHFQFNQKRKMICKANTTHLSNMDVCLVKYCIHLLKDVMSRHQRWKFSQFWVIIQLLCTEDNALNMLDYVQVTL